MINSRQLKWLPKEKKFIGDISEVQLDNYTDVSLRVVSERTGAEVVFVKSRCQEESEGEIGAIILVPEKQYVKKFPKLKDVTITLFND